MRLASVRQMLPLLIIAIAGIAAYSNTIDAPFQFDDRVVISDNPIVKDLTNFTAPSQARAYPEYGIFKRRFVSFLTFAVNYEIHGTDVRGYHVFNLAIHILNALLVYAFVLLTFRTPFMSATAGQSDNAADNPPLPPLSKGGVKRGLRNEGGLLAEKSRYIALIAALLFVAHPVQTEAVTYITQRFASLSAFFYLASMVMYIKWRLASDFKSQISNLKFYAPVETASPSARKELPSPPFSKGGTGGLFYLLSLLLALLAMKSKENALTLPFAIALYELLFFRGGLRKRMFAVVPMFLLLVVFPLSLIDTGLPVESALKALPGPDGTAVYESASAFDMDYVTPPFTPWEYFATQPRVLMTYLRLMFFPVNQNLDYDYPVFNSIFASEVFFSLLFLAGLFGLAVIGYFLSREGNRALRLASFGIFWFFLTISVESSIIPIPMIIAEYRLYLPGLGIILAALAGGAMLIERLSRASSAVHIRTVMAASASIAVLVLMGATYARNGVWQSETGLWEDVVKKSPLKSRGHYNLCVAYKSAGMSDKALEHCLTAARLKPDNADAHNNVALVYESNGLHDKAVEHFTAALALQPDNEVFHNNISMAYAALGILDKALEHCGYAVKLRPDYCDAHFNLGLCHLEKGSLDSAKRAFEETLKINSKHLQAKKFLALVSEPAAVIPRRPRITD